nr:hypothetical protein [uncultured Mediterranean phage uvMED]
MSIVADIVLNAGKEAIVEGTKQAATSLVSQTVSGLFGADTGSSAQEPKLPSFQQGTVRSQRNVESVARGTPVEAAGQPARSGSGLTYHMALMRSFGKVASEGTIGRTISKTELG